MFLYEDNIFLSTLEKDVPRLLLFSVGLSDLASFLLGCCHMELLCSDERTGLLSTFYFR